MQSVYPSIDAASSSDRILIIAPHIDDETIGAGGYALDSMARGAAVFIVFLTAGDCSRVAARLMHWKLDPAPSDYASLGRARVREAAEAMRILGIPRQRWFLLGYPDRGLHSMLERPEAVIRSQSTRFECVPYREAVSPGAPHTLENLVADLRTVVRLVEPTAVIAPVSFDLHPDHAAAAAVAEQVVGSSNVNRLGYLVHGSLLKPLLWDREKLLLPPTHLRSHTWTTYSVSGDAQERKHAALMAYRSQHPYSILLRNAFMRASELYYAHGPVAVHVRHASVFGCAPLSQPSSP
jgi:LmbE family N-acetylglucosaminyl deacetylase